VDHLNLKKEEKSERSTFTVSTSTCSSTILSSNFVMIIVQTKRTGSVPFAHIAIDHSHSQQPVPRGFPLFKHCKWLVVNYNVSKRAPLQT